MLISPIDLRFRELLDMAASALEDGQNAFAPDSEWVKKHKVTNDERLACMSLTFSSIKTYLSLASVAQF